MLCKKESYKMITLSKCKRKIKELLIDFDEIEDFQYLSHQLKSILKQIEGIESIEELN